MRILQLHCDSIEYTPTKKEIKSAEDIDDPQTQKLEELVVVFVAMEDGDDSSVAQNAISQIKNSMEKIGCKSKTMEKRRFNDNNCRADTN